MARTHDTAVSQRFTDLLHEDIVQQPRHLWEARARRCLILARDRMLEILAAGGKLNETQERLLAKANATLSEPPS